MTVDPSPYPNCPPPNYQEVFGVIESSVLGLWDVVNQLSAIQPPKRDRYSVTVFGSARLQPESEIYQGVKQLAAELTKMNCDIITGGGPGLMQAANEGSIEADPANRTQSIGIRINLDFEQDANPFVEQLFHHRTFFSRLHHFVLISDAFVVVPGGIGTTLEAAMVWQLLQVKNLYDTPLVMVGPMWHEFVDWAKRHMLQDEASMASPEDFNIPICVDSYREAIACLKADHRSWLKRCP